MRATSLPTIYLARHGETEWSRALRHTGLTDLPLTVDGERAARSLGTRLGGQRFTRVYTSPLQRAARTCQLAGFGEVAQTDADLVEWDYGDYEGLRTSDIIATRPGWELFRDGCPRGESAADVGARAERILSRLLGAPGDVLVFSSAHLLRVLAARWLRLPPTAGTLLSLSTASVSILGTEHDVTPVLTLWNDTSHLSDA